MNKYKIWSSGYRASGDSGTATYHGVWEGATFNEACARCFAGDNNFHISPDGSPHHWACRLYDNEADARRYFG